MTKYEALAQMVASQFKISGIKANSNLQQSLQQILKTGEARTGKYTGTGRYISKSVWTSEVSAYLDKMGITHECGNDAPRGGAYGEYVRVTMPAFLKIAKKNEAERKARWEAEQAERKAKAEEARKAHHDAMTKKVEGLLDKFLAVDYSFIERKQYAHIATKNEQKGFANAIAEQTGIDYQTCLWFVRGEHFANYMKSYINA